ncbi:MAG: thiamine biosynthesis protein [Ilumatobacteraceae bacterium]|nr:thiamine biosynthesis protein [Ilumatobacteraceae bacterium]
MNGLHVEHVMGMAIKLDLRDGSLDAATLAPVLDWLHHVDATFSTYKHDSVITRLSRGELAIDDLDEETEGVLVRCVELTEITRGAFDAFAVPAPNGTLLDPSGFVKGWSVQRAAEMLERSGVVDFCINAGGDIVVRGSSSGDGAGRWSVGIRHPGHVDQLALAVELEGPMAIATSATYERGAHIIDPVTGQPTIEIASATVVGPDLGTADAFATAVFVMGVGGLDWIEDQEAYSAYVITHDGRTAWSSRFPHPALASAT